MDSEIPRISLRNSRVLKIFFGKFFDFLIFLSIIMTKEQSL